MKVLMNGIWHSGFQPLEGERIPAGSFRDFISADGSSGFKAERDRYHLYVSYACPFAHRTILACKLKGLENVISMSVLSPDWGSSNGWVFGNWKDTTPDIINGFDYLHQVYTQAKPNFTGRVTVPVLWDQKTATIVNNESADILRMLVTEFDAFNDASLDLYPQELRAEIEQINAFVSERINISVYKVGFASSQADYDGAIDLLFDALDTLEAQLSDKQYLVGDRFTQADIRLFVTLVRFDVAYYGALNCNLRHLTDYPNLWNYTYRIYYLPEVAETVKFDHIKRHYFDTYEGVINRRIIPKGPITADCRYIEYTKC
ncbi:glutathione S-transferase family protein [Dendronalium sp. ChiSLP03b]|uniref:glutathione S-transferase family protein n=1 Tax=Dendronalium sp. ChiSLP03b TaxID=3075381 RepID=UPI002AD59771|nr:glutathione S-transferase C-terminal domain-containing protein [Dendronalium sp. ChiSLP03b]MDZ8208718.1 glutathione S-transferase C-terminal domain-containing protein [Dendronalium sp. ChiSLP03b]